MLDPALLLHGVDYFVELAQRLCVVAVAAFACIRLQWVRRALQGVDAAWSHRLVMMLVFGVLGIVATHSGILVSVGQSVNVVDWSAGSLSAGLDERQAMVGFRDAIILAGGLVGGPWVGLGAGLIAGIERHGLGGFAGLASGVGTVLLGGFAGWAKNVRPHWAARPTGALAVAFVGTLLHRLLLLLIVKPYPWVAALSWEVVLPVLLVNCLGCVLFVWVVRDLERDWLKNALSEARSREQEAQSLKEKAELRALRAQISPHFLSNAMDGIRALMRRDAGLAQEYVFKLADFFEATRYLACANTLSLRQELEHLQSYLDLQQLRLREPFHYEAAGIPGGLLDCRLPSLSLLTLAENALEHGMGGCGEGFVLRVEAEDQGECWILRVADNGRGIAAERLALLGKEPVDVPLGAGNGMALYLLRRSLDLAFPGQVDLTVASEPGVGTEVVLTLPKERRVHAGDGLPECQALPVLPELVKGI